MSRTVKRVLILANPYARNGPKRPTIDALTTSLSQCALEPEVVWDREQRAALLADPQLGDRCCCVVSAGGDGSLGDVVNELKTSVPLATLPLGNENLFARHFGFECDGKKVATAIAQGHTTEIDVGVAGQRLFTLMASAGFDGEVVRQVDNWRSRQPAMRPVNRFSYLPRIAAAIRAYDFVPITLEAGGQRFTAAHVFAFNLPQYGMGLGICPRADESDGMLDWIAFEKPGLCKIGSYALSVLRKRHEGRSDVFCGRDSDLRISAEAPVPVQADGDPAGTTPMEISVRSRALRVIVMDHRQ